MNRVPVQSSNVKAIGHDPAENALEIEFNPGRDGQPAIWRYAPVSADTHALIMAAPSVGTAFHEHIRRPGIPGVRVWDEESNDVEG